MQLAKNFLSSYTAILSAAIAVLTPLLDLLIGLQPYMGDWGSSVVTGVAVILFVARAIKQKVVSGE